MVKSILNRRRTKKRHARKRGGSAAVTAKSYEGSNNNEVPEKQPESKTREESPNEKQKTVSLTGVADAAQLAAEVSNPELIIANDAADAITEMSNNEGGYVPFSPGAWGLLFSKTGNIFKKGYRLVKDTAEKVRDTAESAIETAEGVGAIVVDNAIDNLESRIGVDLDNVKPEEAAEDLTNKVENIEKVGKVLAKSDKFKKEIGKAGEVAAELEGTIADEIQEPIDKAAEDLAKRGEKVAENIVMDVAEEVPGVATMGLVRDLVSGADAVAGVAKQGSEVVDTAQKAVDENKEKVNETIEGVTDVVEDAKKTVEEAEAKAKAATQVKVPKIQTQQISRAAAAAGGGRKKRRSTRKRLRQSAKKSMSRVTRSLRKFLRSG